MRVLMFGWEFPPHISGGLGTACEGLTLALNKADVEIIFVVPRLHGDENTPFRMINAREVPICVRAEKSSSTSDQASLRTGDTTFKTETLNGTVEAPPTLEYDNSLTAELTSDDDNEPDVDVDFITSDGSDSSVASGKLPVNHNKSYQRAEMDPGVAREASIGRRLLQTIAITSPLQAYAPSAVMPNWNERQAERHYVTHRVVRRGEQATSRIKEGDEFSVDAFQNGYSAEGNIRLTDRQMTAHAPRLLHAASAREGTMKAESKAKEGESFGQDITEAATDSTADEY
mgnify:CR=1 FL=1